MTATKTTTSTESSHSYSAFAAQAKAAKAQTEKLRKQREALYNKETQSDNIFDANNFQNLSAKFKNMFTCQNDAIKVTPADLKLKLDELKYDANYGNRLANTAKSSAGHFSEQCGKYVRQAIERTGVNLGG